MMGRIKVCGIVQHEGWIESARRVYDTEGIAPTIPSSTGGGHVPKIKVGRVSEQMSVRACLTPEREKKRQNGRRFKEDGEPMFTLTAQDRHGVGITERGGITAEERVRLLTPREYWRLMGFTDDAYDKASAVVSKSQLYKQAGNSIVVPVLEAIFTDIYLKRQPMVKTLEQWDGMTH